MDSGTVELRNGRTIKIKQDNRSQNMFRRVVERATARGMVVNSGKTKDLCISNAQMYKAVSFLLDNDGRLLESGESLKVLGFYFDSRPTCYAHVEALKKRMREKVWVLRHLGRAGFSQLELVTVYKSVIRPTLDYCSVVYHSMLTDYQDQTIERLQSQALKSIYGFGVSYSDMREMTRIPTLRARRIELVDKFIDKARSNPRYDRWFPRRTGRQGSNREEYLELTARTDRLNNTPLIFFRRRLNGKEGKINGERNREYREYDTYRDHLDCLDHDDAFTG